MMRPVLWSLNGLATELEIDRRTLAKRLRHTAGDGQLNGKPAWFLKTALGAIQEPSERSARRANAFTPHGRVDEHLIDELERTNDALGAGFVRMRRESDIAKRREIAHEVGPNIGRLHDLLTASFEAQGDGAVEMLMPWRDQLICGAIGEWLRLCEWSIAP
jgi:hypothetical protein